MRKLILLQAAQARSFLRYIDISRRLRSIRQLLTVGLITLVTACGGGGENSGPSAESPGSAGTAPVIPAAVARITVLPTALLMNSPGQAAKLTLTAYDAAGNVVPSTDVVWTSSLPAHASVDNQGNVRSIAAVGSALVIARVGSIESAPVNVTMVKTLPGTTLVDDDQVVSGPTLLSGTGTRVGSTVMVVLRGISAPPIGGILLSRGSSAVAGRVSAVSSTGGLLSVTLTLVSLPELVASASVRLDFTAAQTGVATANAAAAGDGRRTVLGHSKQAASASKTFGPFTCTGDADFSVVSVDIGLPSLKQTLTSYAHVEMPDGHLTLLDIEADGSIEASIDGSMTIGAVEGGIDCRVPLTSVVVPLAGWLSVVIAPEFPIDAKLAAALSINSSLSYKVEEKLKLAATLGIKYTDTDGFINVNKLSLEAKSESSPSFQGLDVKAKLNLFAGVATGLSLKAFGTHSPIVDVGIGQSYAWTGADPNLAAMDETFTSADETSLALTYGPGSGLQDLIDAVHLSTLLTSVHISGSRTLVSDASPKLKEAKTDLSIFSKNDTVTFAVSLNPGTVHSTPLVGLPSYNVREVRVYRLDYSTLTPRAYMVATAPAPDGQSDFKLFWVADADGSVLRPDGKPNFYAFVVPSLFPVVRDLFPAELGPITAPSAFYTYTGQKFTKCYGGAYGIAPVPCSGELTATVEFANLPHGFTGTASPISATMTGAGTGTSGAPSQFLNFGAPAYFLFQNGEIKKWSLRLQACGSTVTDFRSGQFADASGEKFFDGITTTSHADSDCYHNLYPITQSGSSIAGVWTQVNKP